MSYRAVIIGCGGRAAAHVDAYQFLPDAQVVACCAPTPRRRDPLAERYGLRAYADAAEMIRVEKPDIAHIITWPDSRLELMSLVSDLGVPLCTVEKPIATGVPDWHALQELERASATRFAVCHQVRWHPLLTRCRDAVAAGQIGAPQFVHLSSGMNIAGQGTHTLNYGRSFVGDPLVTRVFANASGWDEDDPGHPGPAASAASLEFENGVTGLWTTGEISPRAGDSSTTWQHVRIAAYGTIGSAVYEEFGRWAVSGASGLENGDYGGMEQWRANNVRAQAGFHRAMFDWLVDPAREPGTSLRYSLHEWAVVLATYSSALEHKPIAVAGFEPASDLIELYRRAVSAQEENTRET